MALSEPGRGKERQVSLSLRPCDLADPVLLVLTVVGKDGKPQIVES